MRIGIITQQLQINYGGLLQNYALQQVLKQLGHVPYTINRKPFIYFYPKRKDLFIKLQIKRFIRKYLGMQYLVSYRELYKTTRFCRNFVEQNITTTPAFENQKQLSKIIKEHNFDAYIVGSDQVWRPMFSENIYNDFLTFCQKEENIKRLAYAASFGVNEWEFNEEQTKECSRLVKLFDAVSVREDSGMELCKEHLNVDAIHVLDPTLLLEKENYIELVERVIEPVSDGNLFCYILDINDSIKNSIKDIEKKLLLKSFQVKADKDFCALKLGDNINDHTVPSPTKWLRAFMDAKMVFTDSFHGCVFSIIFNKPFWVIGNKERGNARFDSLLKLFKLEDRRISLDEINNLVLTKPIDWDKVNTIKKEWQKKSFDFLKNNL